MHRGDFRSLGESTFFLQDYASKQFQRVASSTLMAESAALAQALAHLEWMVVWRGYTTSQSYERPRSKQGEIELVAIEKGMSIAHDSVIAIVDSKSLYDVMIGESLTSIDKKAALEVLQAKDVLRSLDGSCKWAPHSENIADSLTKEHANHHPLIQVIKLSHVRVQPVEVVVEQRKAYRELHQRQNPRPKISKTSEVVQRRASMSPMPVTSEGIGPLAHVRIFSEDLPVLRMAGGVEGAF